MSDVGGSGPNPWTRTKPLDSSTGGIEASWIFTRDKLLNPRRDLLADLSPRARAAVLLMHRILYITAGTLLVLIAYLVLMDAWVVRWSTANSPDNTLRGLDQLSTDLRAARRDSSQKMSTTSIENAEKTRLAALDSSYLTDSQSTQLDECIALPPGPSRDEKLENCIKIVDAARQIARKSAQPSCTNQERQTLRQFWLQMAQLVLLNLLLPLLTALLGYTFGTQEAQAASGGR